MEYEFEKKMSKQELLEFLKTITKEIEQGKITNPQTKEKHSINNPRFMIEYEYLEKEYGKKLKIIMKMKDYD